MEMTMTRVLIALLAVSLLLACSPEPQEPAAAPAPRPEEKATEPAPLVAAETVHTGRLVLVTQPPGADIYIDRQKIGRTPQIKELDLPAGTHHLKLTHPKRQPYLEQIEVPADGVLKRRIRLKALR